MASAPPVFHQVSYENQFGDNSAVRSALELTGGVERYAAKIPHDDITTVRRLGVAVDVISYLSGGRHNGAGFYALFGLGVHRIEVDDQWETVGGPSRAKYSDTAPALSVGLGCHLGRFFGMEYKHTFSVPKTAFPDGVGTEWGQFTLNLRFPVPGAPKGPR